jgi:hypothetical protein
VVAPSGESTARPDLDPIEWAIIGIIIAGANLALAIDKKIAERRDAKSGGAREKAVNGNLLRLSNLKSQMQALRHQMEAIHKIGHIEVDKEKRGIDASSLVFDDDESAERFNRIFDTVLQGIGRINRLISEIDIEGLPLNEDDVAEFVRGPVAEIKERTRTAIHPDNDPYQRLKETDGLLQVYEQLIGDLQVLLERRK